MAEKKEEGVFICGVWYPLNTRGIYLPAEGLTKLPEELLQLEELEVLDVSFNDLTYLPESIGQLVNLRELYVHYNKLTSLPESIGKLVNLRELYGYNNKLTSLPESIGRVVKLEYISNVTVSPLLYAPGRELMETSNYMRKMSEKLEPVRERMVSFASSVLVSMRETCLLPEDLCWYISQF